ncbi:hypothetical protein [Stenomitos frigidus]|nr:hypothetical protein [Stenomitos frigidus]
MASWGGMDAGVDHPGAEFSFHPDILSVDLLITVLEDLIDWW